MYGSNETGRSEVYVEAFPGPGARAQISSDGGSQPRWAARSNEIFFRRDNELRVVRVRNGGEFTFDPPVTVVAMPFAQDSHDVIATGDRILALRTPDAPVPRRIETVTDWVAQLSKLAPQGGR